MDIADRKKILTERMHSARDIAKNASEAALKLEGAIEVLTEMEQEQARNEQKIDRPKPDVPEESVRVDSPDNRSADTDNDRGHAANSGGASSESGSGRKLDGKKQTLDGKGDRSGTVSDLAASRPG